MKKHSKKLPSMWPTENGRLTWGKLGATYNPMTHVYYVMDLDMILFSGYKYSKYVQKKLCFYYLGEV